MTSWQQYLIVTLTLILATGVLWAVAPYLDVFSSDPFRTDRAFEDLTVESKTRFGHRFVVGMGVGAGIALVWIGHDVVREWRRRPRRGEAMRH